MLPSPEELTYFLEVSQTLNFSRAAERIGISQPSLSLAMQRLENNIGVPLFVRSKKGVQLTGAGQNLLGHVRQMIQTWGEAKAQAVLSKTEVAGHYTIGTHPSVALYSLPGFLPGLLNKFPKLEIKLVHDLSRKITESVISQRIDLGIVVNSTRHPDLVIRHLCNDEVTFWKVSNSNEDVLICEPDLLQTQDLLKKMKRSGLKFGRIVFTSSLELVTRLTAEGCGTGILPGRVAAQEPRLKRIKDAPVFHDDISVIYRVENKGVQAIQTMVQAIAKVLA